MGQTLTPGEPNRGKILIASTPTTDWDNVSSVHSSNLRQYVSSKSDRIIDPYCTVAKRNVSSSIAAATSNLHVLLC